MKSMINWPFRRKSWNVNKFASRSSPNLTDISSDSVSNILSALKSPLSRKKANQNKFLGRKLESICSVDGNLPLPIVNMMKRLYLEGPFTVGIFRKSANARLVRELEAKLEQDPSFPLDDVSIIVIGSVFKDFLRRIPNGLLDSRLFNEWVKAVSPCNSEEETKEQLVHLVKKIPAINQMLLRHVLCLLHLISSHSDDNKMCSMNLAVCIGPSLLYSPSRMITADKREEVSKFVPKVISHLIESWPSLFYLVNGRPNRTSTSSLFNLTDIGTPTSSSLEEVSPSVSSLTNSNASTPTTPPPPITPLHHASCTSLRISPPSYQETMARIAAQMAVQRSHYHQAVPYQKPQLRPQHQMQTVTPKSVRQLPVTQPPLRRSVSQVNLVQSKPHVPHLPSSFHYRHFLENNPSVNNNGGSGMTLVITHICFI